MTTDQDITDQQETTATAEELAGYLATRRRPTVSGLGPLVLAPHHDRMIAALLGMAVVADEHRTAACAQIAHQWGCAIVRDRIGRTPHPLVAVYCGGTRLAAYLSGTAVAAHCRTHPTSDYDEPLHHLVDQITISLGNYPHAHYDPALMGLGLQLRRHTAQYGYTTPDWQMLTDLARVASVDTATKPPTIGKLAHAVYSTAATYGNTTQLRDILQTATLTVE